MKRDSTLIILQKLTCYEVYGKSNKMVKIQVQRLIIRRKVTYLKMTMIMKD